MSEASTLAATSEVRTMADLEAAVVANPEDLAPRWAIAARLEAAGEMRGIFIRRQLEASAERRANGDTREADQWEHTASAMLQKHGAGWARAVEPFSDQPRFSRGFVEGVTMDARDFLARGAELYQVAPIRHLSLRNAPPVMAELMTSPLLRRVASLSFQSDRTSKIGDEGADALVRSTQLPKLRILGLGFNGITRQGLEALVAAPSLGSLIHANLAGNPCGDPQETFGACWASNHIYRETISLPPLGQELEAKYGHIPWMHAPSLLKAYPVGDIDV